MPDTSFTPEMFDHLGHYVYRLIDPRNGQTFYVGKGTGNRVFSHAKGEKDADNDEVSDKLKRIQAIESDGFEVTHVIHRHGLDDKTAFEVEAALIDAYPEATNGIAGHGSGERGAMHSQLIIKQYQAKEIDVKHKLLMLIVNQSVIQRGSLYEAVRYAWVLDSKKAQKAEFVLAVLNGLVIGVFVPEKWLQATKENFPHYEDQPKRWGFAGREAPKDILNHYLGTKLPDYMRKKGAANPVRYSD